LQRENCEDRLVTVHLGTFIEITELNRSCLRKLLAL
jgi:hypothetical protein